MKGRKIFALLMVVLLMVGLVLAGCAKPAPTPAPAPAPKAELPSFKFKAAQAMMTKDTLTHQDLIEFTGNITKGTNGKITFEVFGPEIGDWTELDVMNMKGTVELQFNARYPSYDPRENITSLPFLAPGFKEANEACKPGGVFERIERQWAKSTNQYYLATFLNNMGMLGLKSKVIKTPEEAKGVKIRCWPGETPKCYVAKMGFTPVTIPWAEAPTAIGTGIADGWVGSGSVYHYTLFRDVAKVQMKTFDFMEMWHVIINLDAWNRLPKEFQDVVQKASYDISLKRLSQLEAEENEYSKKLVDYGWTVVDMPKNYPKELARWAELARECWKDLEPLIGKAWIDEVKVAMGYPVTK